MKKLLTSLLSIIAIGVFAQGGSWDTTFEVGTGANQNVYTIKQMPDGKILIGGQFTEYNGEPAYKIAKLNTDGSLDDSWSSQYQGEAVGDVLIEEDGKIVIGELFGGVKRLNADGTLDTSFNAPYNFGYDMSFIARQGDKYIVSGAFSIYAGEGFYRNILRLNHDGSVDTTFATLQLYGTYARAYTIEDKIFVVGTTQYYNETPVGSVFMLNADGSLDNSFTPVTVNDGIARCMARQQDGKFVLAGAFMHINSEERNMIARVNADGSLDDSFVPPAGDSVQAMTMVVQPDGRILTGGWFFDSYVDLGAPEDDSIIIYMQRYNEDGSIDASFDTGADFDNPVNAVSLQDDGKILAGGWFTNFDGIERPRVARLDNEFLASGNFTEVNEGIRIYPNPASEIINIKTPFATVKTVTIYDISGKAVYNTNFESNLSVIDIANLSAGLYLLKISDADKIVTRKFIKQ